VAAEANHTYIRNINTTSVSGGGTDTVTINLATGLLGHLSSSRRYKEGMINAMLLNEFLKEHKTVQNLKSTVLEQQSIIAQQRENFERRLAEQEKQIRALLRRSTRS
jgi:predicted ribosome quality control (RQC) complex YloA/Tae2 family protein